jgi:PAS domain S-box-containing protein
LIAHRDNMSLQSTNPIVTTPLNFYKHIVDAVSEGLWIIDTAGRTIFVNTKMAEILGLTVDFLSHQSLQQYAGGDTGLFAAMQRVGQGLDNGTTGEWTLSRHDDTTRWVRVSINVLYDDDGRCSGALAIITDITALKQAQMESRFQAYLLDMVGYAILAVDLNGKVLYRNPFTDLLYGTPGIGTQTLSRQELAILIRVSMNKSWSGELLLHRSDESTFPAMITASPLYEEQGERLGTVITLVDITTQKQVEKTLGLYVKRLENLREIDREILMSGSPERIAHAVVTNIRQLVACSRVSVSLYDFEVQESVLIAVYTVADTSLPAGTRSILNRFELPAELMEGRTYITDDIEKFPGELEHLRRLKAEGARAYVRVPLIVQGELIGSLNMAADDVSIFTPEHLEVAREIADQLAIALQNAQLVAEVRQHALELETRVAERTHELAAANDQLQAEIHERRQAEAAEREQRTFAEALQDTATALNSTLNLDEVLDRILANVVRVVQHDVSNICFVEGDRVRIVRSRGYHKLGIEDAVLATRWAIADVPLLKQIYDTKRPGIVSTSPQSGHQVATPEFQLLQSSVGAPIQSDGEVIGFIILSSVTADFFTQTHADRLNVFADQAAVAIQNARLYERSRQVAILEERQRLSHELHDSVSQTLWSASLLSDVLPDLWEQDKEEGLQTLNRLRQLSRGALAEMRTLLLELHPTALIEVHFNELLQRLAEVTTGRTRIPVTLTIEGQPVLPPDVQIALYRIAQEALNNIARHSVATQIEIDLKSTPEQVALCIKDNGHGFAPERIRPGHLGVGIMRDRAREINADLNIDSQLGEGTIISVLWPANKDAMSHA